MSKRMTGRACAEAVRAVLLAVLLLPAAALCMPSGSFEVDLEAGMVFPGYNDVRSPGDTGTEISLSQELEADTDYFYRVRFTWAFRERHSLSLLVAPLRVASEGQVSRPIRFEGVEFAADTRLKANYRFDSYRLTYRYDLMKRQDLQAGIGFTAKIRDAAISLEDAEHKAEKTNTGPVPLVNFRVAWQPRESMAMVLEGDALAAPQGRAEDVLVSLQYKVDDPVTFKIGYRILEGGADNDEVYTFSLFNYAAAGIIVTF